MLFRSSMERFIGILTENFKAAFPFWLSPYQVGIVPIRTEHNEYAKKVFDVLSDKGIRCEVDYADKNMNEKIKTYKTFKDPYIIVLGDNEAADNTVSINIRGVKQQLRDVPLDKFVDACAGLNKDRSLDLLTEI